MRVNACGSPSAPSIPRSVDLSRHGTVVLWCVPATVRIAVAPLR